MDTLFLIEVLQVLTASSILFVWVVRYDNIITEFQQYQLPVWLRDMVGILKLFDISTSRTLLFHFFC